MHSVKVQLIKFEYTRHGEHRLSAKAWGQQTVVDKLSIARPVWNTQEGSPYSVCPLLKTHSFSGPLNSHQDFEGSWHFILSIIIYLRGVFQSQAGQKIIFHLHKTTHTPLHHPTTPLPMTTCAGDDNNLAIKNPVTCVTTPHLRLMYPSPTSTPLVPQCTCECTG